MVEGVLKGIKGQYLLLDQDRVFNVRAHEGFIANFSSIGEGVQSELL